MADQSIFRCYYDDGTIETSTTGFCPDPSVNGSPLVNSELTIITDTETTTPFPWWILLVIAALALSESKRR